MEDSIRFNFIHFASALFPSWSAVMLLNLPRNHLRVTLGSRPRARNAAPQTVSSFARMVSVSPEIENKLVVGKPSSLWQAVHSLANFC